VLYWKIHGEKAFRGGGGEHEVGRSKRKEREGRGGRLA